MKYIAYVILLVTLSCCNTNRKKFVHELRMLYDKDINFSNDSLFYVNGMDSVIPDSRSFKYKIVCCTKPTECELCDYGLEKWDLKIKEIKSYSSDVNFIFVICSNDYERFERYAGEALPGYPFIYDCEFLIRNGIPEDEEEFHTFLLDSNNHVVLVGSPIANDDLWELYKKMMLSER